MTKRDVWNVPPIIPNKAQSRMNGTVAPLRRQKPLNGKEWKFVQEYVTGDGRVTLKEAAIRAGYRPTSASVDRKSTRLNSSHMSESRMPSSA